MDEALAPQAKRRARTRAALLSAARELLAERETDASIDTITRRAGVGFGSFFNHFPGGKSQLFEEAALELLDQYAHWLAEATDGLDDPREVFARSFRLTGRLAIAQPSILAPLTASGTDILFADGELRRQAMSDIEAGMRTGHFVEAPVIGHLVAVGSLLLGLVSLIVHADSPEVPPVDAEVVDATAAAALRALGVDPGAADEFVRRELPTRFGESA